jgi:Ni,Fe-hydrogenase III large subunit
VAYICGLETAGKITPNDAHRRIRALYEELERTHMGLGISDKDQ